MKTKLIGLFTLLFFVLVAILIQDGSPILMISIPPALLVLGITGGLTIMYYKKGVHKEKLLKRMKSYFIFSGYMSFLISLIMVLSNVSNINVFSKNLATALVSLIYAYLGADITDSFME